MKRVKVWDILLSSSFAIAMMASLNAMAQDTTEDSAEGDDYEDVLEEVFVVGVRGAIERAQVIKMEADTVVEAVTFEDLGQFSDESIADTLQRVPGVQIQRNDQGIQGDRVSIRGLGGQFVQTTINGRSPLSSGSEGAGDLRQFNFEVIPTEVTSGILVYKTGSAVIPETGLAGSVDVQTLKPLDAPYKGGDRILMAGTLRYSMDEYAEEWDPRVSGLISWKNENETVGVYLSGMWTETTLWADEFFARGAYRTLNLDNDGDGVKDGTMEDVYTPSSITQNPIRGERNLTSFSGAIQFRPTDNLEFTVDAISADYEVLSNRNNFRTLWSQGGGIYRGLFTPESLVVENGGVMYMNPALMTGAETRVRARMQNLQFDNVSDMNMIGFNGKWEDNDWQVNFDYARSEMHFEQLLRSIGTRDARGLDQSQIVWDARNSFIPYTELGPQYSDLSEYSFFGGVGYTEKQTESEQDSIRLDIAYELNDSWTLRGGMRYTDTLVDVRRTNNLLQKNSCTAPNGITGAERAAMWDAAYANGGTFGPFLPGENIAQSVWALIDHAAGVAAAPACYNEVTAHGTPAFNGDLEEQFEDDILNAGQSFWIEEQTLAFYGQVDFDLQWGSVPVTGNFGLRAVETSDNALGSTQTTYTDPAGEVPNIVVGGVAEIAANSRWDYLPSLNTNFALRENIALRLSVQQTMTRPNYTDLVTREALRRQNPEVPDFDPNENGTGAAGNADLKPYTAWQYDATLEYYTENGGALYASLFYKDVTDFILAQSLENVRLDGHDDILWDVTRKVNFSDGTVKGFEIGLNQPFNIGSVEGFGVQTNYTYVDSEFDELVGDGGYGFPGASQDNFNLVTYYDHDRFTVRLAYVYRGEFLAALGKGGIDRANIAMYTKAQNRLDAKVDFHWTPRVVLTASGTNLTGQDRENFVDHPSIFRDFIQRGKRYTLALRVKY
jgi:TonB-dependent receptor